MNAITKVSAKEIAFQEMRDSTDLLDDKAALAARFDEDGYMFFRGVLDLEAIGRLREVYVGVLRDDGVIDETDKQYRYNGADLSQFPRRGGTISLTEALPDRMPWRQFVAEPAIDAFFRRLLGDDPFWLPIVEYKAIATAAPERARLDFVHQDSFYNEGIPFLICWIPLWNIDADVGGLAVVRGSHKGPILHDLSKPPLFPIPEEAIPENGWYRADYRPGDLVVMKLNTVHSGLSNLSDRFRLSMDIRVMPKSGADVPIVGSALQVSTEHVLIKGDDGRIEELVIDDDTYLRNLDAKREERARAAELFPPGTPLIVASANGKATVVRRQH